MTLAPAYRMGTHRLCSPEETLARVTPHLATFGITRCANVTGLDADLGMPVYMAIRPRGRVLQSSAGKGISIAAAKVSALMEAVELDVAERPSRGKLRRASQKELAAEGLRVDSLPEWVAAASRYMSDGYRIDWTEADDMMRGGKVWVPAGAAYFWEPSPCRTNTNGLASGNHVTEATLHGLYEVIERDAVAKLVDGDRIAMERALVIDPGSVREPSLARVIARIEATETKIVIAELKSGLAVPTYWSLLLNKRPFAGVSTLNAGYGTHLDPSVALSRALSEAVQSRLTMIHGAREDIVSRHAYADQVTGAPDVMESPAFRFFDALAPEHAMSDAAYEGDLEAALDTVLALLGGAGHERVYRVDMGCPVEGLSVVKVIAPALGYEAVML